MLKWIRVVIYMLKAYDGSAFIAFFWVSPLVAHARNDYERRDVALSALLDLIPSACIASAAI